MSTEWKLVWADEFDKPGLADPQKWNYEEGFVRNNELQFYTVARPENARIEDEGLIIEARREPWQGADYTSASLNTCGKADWLYGRFEMRAKLPRARGSWPAFWMLGSNYPKDGWPRCGEIDVMEHVGHEPGAVYGHLHFGATKETYEKHGAKIVLPDVFSDFHVYAVEWQPDRIDFCVDGNPYHSLSRSEAKHGFWPFDRPHFLLINLAIGGIWGGEQGVNETAFPQRYVIDYVRVYQNQGAVK
jgi:beta-glucanase (GH16 family)